MMRQLRGGGFALDIIGRAKLWALISAGVLLVSIGSLAIRGINAGLEFRGGTSFQVQAADEDASVDDMRRALTEIGLEDPVVQRIGDRGFLVQTRHLGSELQQAGAQLVARVAGVDVGEVTVTDVGPKWGQQVSEKALRAFLVFLVVAVLYISIRLEPKMAAASLVALLHDLVITAGIYSLIGFVVTPATVIALLTILGYSLYDAVVIFDRVKERTATLSAARSLTYSGAANQALNQVFVRSISTSITSLLPVGSLLFVGSFLLGAETLRELALALFIGLTVGTYSSIFVATPFLAWWKEHEPRWATLRARIAARAAESGGAVPPRAPGLTEGDRAPVSVGPGGPGPSGRRPPKKKKRKRR